MVSRSTHALSLAAGFLLVGCGGARPTAELSAQDAQIAQESKITQEDLIPRAILDKAEFTTQVDAKRFRVAGDVATAFEPTQKIIYMVSTLKRVPTQADIEVRWYKDNIVEPLLVQHINGSDTFSFISEFSPEKKKFIPGAYTARIFVDDREVGGKSFTIIGEDPLLAGPGIKKLVVSPRITKKMQPTGGAKKFPLGTRELHATFDVVDAIVGTTASVRWMRGDIVFDEQNLQVRGTGRFGAQITSPSGLPAGAYQVEVEMGGQTAATAQFVVGDTTVGPGVDKIALGLALGPDNLPVQEKTEFIRGTKKLVCGLRFLDLPPETIITVQWILLMNTEESVYHTVKNALPTGGSGTLGAPWEIDEGLEAGDYLLRAIINDEPVTELRFVVK